MRRAKKIVLWSLGALLLAASAAAVFLATAGDDFYRWAMGRAIEGRLDREIHVDGSFSFDVGLEPTLIVTDVWIENAPWADKKEMARAERIEVQIALEPLFSGIVRIPRLVVEGLALDLETSADGESNWEIAGASSEDDDTDGPEELSYPLFEFVSLKDIAVTHIDRRSGRDTEILLDFLRKRDVAAEAGLDIEGEGSLNKRTFQITGRFGSIEEALAATAPFPLELTLQSSSLVVELAGTAQNFAKADGFDLSLSVRTPSIGEVLRTFEIDLPLVGLAEASARLRGNLESLAVEDIDLEVVDRFGQELRAQGSLADLINGEGLDLRFTGELGPEVLRLAGELPPALDALLSDVVRLDVVGRITGDLEAPAVTGLHAGLKHGSGGVMSLQGQVALDLSEDGAGLTALEATALLSLPDQALLEQALETPLPDLGAINGTASLAWDGDWIVLRSAEAEAESMERLQLSAEGRIGKLSGRGFSFELDPRIDLSAAINHSRPLVALIDTLTSEAGPPAEPSQEAIAPSGSPPQQQLVDFSGDLVLSIQRGLGAAGLDPGPLDGLLGSRTRAAIKEYQTRHGLTVDGRATESLLRRLRGASDVASREASPVRRATATRVYALAESLPELGPIMATARLSREDGAYRFDDLNLTLGRTDGLRVEVTGTLGALHPEGDVVLDEIALAASFTVPSSKAFSRLLPPEVPEFRKVRGRFDVQGTTETLSISGAGITAEGPDGLVATVSTSQVAQLSLATGFTTKDLALELDARWPNTESLYRLVDLDLPDLGPVWARATLRNRGETFALTGITVTAGSPDQPTATVTGEIGDLPALRRVTLTGEFDVATGTLLDDVAAIQGTALGKVHGRFNLSDTDGSIGIEALSAEIEDTKLISLSIKGLFDDIEHGDDLRVEAALTVPDISQLGREFGFEAEHFGSLSFEGQVSGSDERFRAEGKARFGETDVTGSLSGSLVGERPVLQVKLHSPLFRLADVGLVPQADAPERPPEPAANDKPQETASANRLVFGEAPIPFEVLKDFDLDLDVLFEDVEGIHLDIDTLEGRLDVVDGVLRVDPLSFVFVGGRVDLTLMADARGELPKLHLGLAADDVDLGDFLSQSEVEVPLDGELDLAVDLKAVGLSPRALASSLEGEFDLAIERGRIRTSLLRLTTTNPVSWMFTEARRKGYSELNCLILRFDLEDGVAESETILVDTTNVLALGQGRIDLRDEFIDIAFSPRAKSRRLISMSTPFGIKGPLAGPSVEVSSAGASARTVGEVLLSPINLLGSLLPFVSDHGKDEDNPCLALRDGVWRQR